MGKKEPWLLFRTYLQKDGPTSLLQIEDLKIISLLTSKSVLNPFIFDVVLIVFLITREGGEAFNYKGACRGDLQLQRNSPSFRCNAVGSALYLSVADVHQHHKVVCGVNWV